METQLRTEVLNHKGAPSLFINGNPHTGLAFWHSKPFDATEDYSRFAKAGVEIITASIGSIANPADVTSDGAYPFTHAERVINTILAAHPKALILPRINLNPSKAWLEAHAASTMRHIDVLSGEESGHRVSFSSAKWQEVAAEFLRRFTGWCEEKWANTICGYHVCAGDCGEWAYSWNRELSDYSPAQQRAFRDWLKQQYKDDVPELRQAWKDNLVTFDTAQIPKDRTRPLNKPPRMWCTFNPEKEKPVIDYLTFHSQAMARAILHFCGVTKQALAKLGRTKICGVFYGYHFFIQNNPYGMHNAGQHSQDLIFTSPDVDFLAVPLNYQERHAGGVYFSQLAAASVRLNNKLYYCEDDTYTCCAKPTIWRYRCPDQESTINVLRRNFFGVLRDGGTQWWMDLIGEGWYRDDKIMDAVAAMRRFAESRLKSDRSPTAQIAAIISPASARFLRYDPALIDALLANQMSELQAIGAPVDVYLTTDLNLLLDTTYADQYRFFIFLDALYLSQQEREIIARKLCRSNRTVLWNYAAGLFTDDTVSPSAMAEVTGINLAMLEQSEALTQAYRAITFVTGDRITYGSEEDIAPQLYGDDQSAEVLGWLIQRGQPALLRKNMSNWTSIWSAVPTVPTAVLRTFARDAGVHLYTERAGDQVLAAKDFIAVHAQYDGQRTISLTKKCKIVDIASGKEINTSANSIKIDLKRGETEAWRLE